MNIHNGHIFVFGGLIEVTHESDEIFKFDPARNSWSEISMAVVS